MNEPTTGVIDLLRHYTALRGLAVALLFATAALIRVPAVVIAVLVHLLERSSDRLLTWCQQIPPQPRRTRRSFRGETR